MIMLLTAAMLCAAAALAEDALTPADVKTMAQAERFVPVDSVWTDGWPSYAQEYGFEPIKLTPSDAYAALYKAYESKRDEGCIEVMKGWGFAQMEEYSVPYGWPKRETIAEEARLGGVFASLEVIRFQGGYADVSDNVLIFLKKEYGDWQLIDFVKGDVDAVRVLSDEGDDAMAVIELLQIGHGTGHYSEQISVYNPVNRRCEAGYTRVGYECPLMDRNLYLSAWADYTYEGLRVVTSVVFGTYEWMGEQTRMFTQRAQAADVYVYAYDAGAQSLRLRVHESHEDLSPAALRAQSIDAYLNGRIFIVN